MNIDISKNEAWKMIDAIESYRKNYALTGPVEKLLNNLIKKLKNIVESWAGWEVLLMYSTMKEMRVKE